MIKLRGVKNTAVALNADSARVVTVPKAEPMTRRLSVRDPGCQARQLWGGRCHGGFGAALG
jgi:hypothetical protein